MLKYLHDIPGDCIEQKVRNVVSKMRDIEWTEQYTIFVGDTFLNSCVQSMLSAKYIESDIPNGVWVFDDNRELVRPEA